MAKYRSSENATIVRTDAYAVLKLEIKEIREQGRRLFLSLICLSETFNENGILYYVSAIKALSLQTTSL